MTDALDRLKAALADRYTIDRELGQGGMATVYLAEDLKHHRKVALKVLRPEIAVTVGAGRFSREIEVAARLQHPNILPLLDSGEAAGFFFYVMPYVEGESLRERLARGGELPVQDAVRILMEVADALSEAHAHGVVHRDIKPDNVMLRGRHALVADFGVAKAVTEATGQQLLTSTGVALGTPMYMAPEQAMADPHQDHRVDIYALGLLGYELLTGRAPFSATTAQEMLAAHVTAVPDPVEKYRAAVSPALAQIIMRCLAKKPADRWQTAEEVLQHLEPLATPSGGTTPAQTRPTTAFGRLPRWGRVGAGGAALAVVALAVGQLLRTRPLTITISDMTQVTSEPGVEFQPAISPSGNEVAYVTGPIQLPRLGIRSTANVAGGEVRLASAALGGEWYPSWSPDGESVWFSRCSGAAGAGCGTYEAGRLGGVVRPAGVPPEALGGLTYRSPDGAQLAFVRADTVFTVSASGAGRRLVAIHKVRYEYLHSLAWSPDGTRIAYVNGNRLWRISGNLGGSSIWIVGAGGGEPQPITTSEHLNISPAWLDPRHLLFVSDRDGQRAVYVVEVEPNGHPGEPRLVPGVADPHSISFSIRARKLAYAKFILRQNVWSYPLGRSAPVSIRAGQPVTTGTQVIETHDVSPDGRSMVYDGTLRGHKDLYRIALGDAQNTPLTGSIGGEAPRWSPNAREIAFHSVSTVPGSVAQIMVIPAEGGSPVALTADSGRGAFVTWSPDGRQIAYHAGSAPRRSVWLLSRDELGAPWQPARPLTDFPCTYPDWAPDGSALVCEVAPMDVVLVSPQGGQVQRRGLLASLGLRRLPIGLERFSRDGRIIYSAAAHRDGRRGIWAVPVTGNAARLVIAFDDPALTSLGVMSVGPGNIYLTVSEYESDIWVAKLRW